MDLATFVLYAWGNPGIGPVGVNALLRFMAAQRMAPEGLLAVHPEDLAIATGIALPAITALVAADPARVARAEASMRKLRRHDVQMLTTMDAAYPHRLASRLVSAPPVVFLYGRSALLGGRLVAVATSRGTSESVHEQVGAMVQGALNEGFAVVCGHNTLEYQRTALVARRMAGPVCYVLDRGLNRAFGADYSRDLFAAARIWNPRYSPQADLAISPFAPDEPMLGHHNRIRDQLVFGLADLIIAGTVRLGGSMHACCRNALARGTPVLCVDTDTPGSRDLLANGAARYRGTRMPAPTGNEDTHDG